MMGWLLDIYPDYTEDALVYWVRTRKGAHKVVERRFVPRIYAHGSGSAMDDLEKALPILDTIGHVRREMKSTWLGEEPREVLSVDIKRYSRIEDVAHTIDNRGRYRDFSLFNVDLRFSQRFFAERDLFPMGLMEFRPAPTMLEERFAFEYEKPPLKTAVLAVSVASKYGVPAFDDRLVGAEVGSDRVDGDEEHVLNGIEEMLDEVDPDIVYTDGGDAFAIPYLYKKAKTLGRESLRLGRDDDDVRTERKGRSYFTYGQIKYKPPSYSLRGRVHIDRSSSFMYIESGLDGLIDLSRISAVPLQELARLSPGSAISSMEVDQALRDGCLVLWKKNVPEEFKTAQELIVSDRGGFIYEPVVGVHDRVLEVDFTSLYPNIMVRFNISPETIMCGCCPDPSRRVPVLGYPICDRRLGLIPRVLKPVVERRTRLKRRVREGAGATEGYKERVDILKWLLVTCLDGATEVPFKRDGRFDVRPISDIVDRECAEGCGELPLSSDIQLFGLDDDLQPELKTARSVFRFPAPDRMVRLTTGNGEVLTTPDHPCLVVRGRGTAVKRADRVVKGDSLPTLPPLYGRASSRTTVESIGTACSTSDHVYCFSVDEPLHGFALANGIVTHNCFGYTGYKNARFGRIECHEAINAYGRELMLQASEIAEAHGFEILHGIVDSLWLKGNGDPRRFCEHVSGHIGIPLEPEGIYKWVVFLPDRAHGVGALNRYYGLFEDGRLKLRGIELRRRDSCGLVRDMQEDLLERFKKADDSKELMGLVPEALEVLDRYVDDAISGTVPPHKLLVTKRVSKTLDEYRQVNDAAVALHQLDAEGMEVNPGEQVRFVITCAGSKDLGRRVSAEPFASEGDYDPEAYVDLLIRASETLLMPMGLDREKLLARRAGKGLKKAKFDDCSKRGVSNEYIYIG